MEPQSPHIPTTFALYCKFHNLATDAEWEGNLSLAHRYRAIAHTYRQRHDAGDLFEPPF